MSNSEPDVERLLREACPPVEPSPAAARAISRLLARPPLAARIARLALPYAAGVLTVLAVEHLVSAPSPAAASPRPSLESIADRLPPPPPPPPPATSDEPAPAASPVPRIS